MLTQAIRSVRVPADTLENLIGEFRRDINSKRSESRISSLAELIELLYKRNLLRNQTSEILLHTVLSSVNPSEQQIVREFLKCLLKDDECLGEENVYGECEP